MKLQSYAKDSWIAPEGNLTAIPSAVSGETVAETGTTVRDYAAMLEHARNVGGPALRAMTFHQRAKMLKALGDAVMAKKDALYELSYETGATKSDSWIDIEGGAGTLYAYSSKGRRELPNDTILIEGAVEGLSKRGTFVGQHVLTSRQGAAVHINAFNFPVWGMLEKLGPTLLAGVPAIVKPATATAYLTEAAFRVMIEANVLPKGALQLIIGPTGDLFDHLSGQDVVSFTGSADTAQKLQRHPVIARESVRFIAERDSLNAAVLGPDAAPGTPEFDLFIKEVVREMTTKAGQKCTAIRRAFVPTSVIDAAEAALKTALGEITVGDPRAETTKMGALVSTAQRDDVRAKIKELSAEARIVFGDPNKADGKGAFMQPVLLRCDAPGKANRVHDTEPFGPVTTLMPYSDINDAIALVNRGQGSLVMSLYTYDPNVARTVLTGSGAFHGRLFILDRDCAKESTGHGSPLPALIHGGPGRAGGGEEMGGLHGVMHYMQRTALQGSPRMLSGVTHDWMRGAPEDRTPPHPFRLKLGELEPGKTLITGSRTITLDDIEHFAHFTGDTFYAHMDEEAAKANPLFGGRVAHGYLLLSFAAGLFVDPAPGPVLANFGLDNLRFTKPVKPGDTITVQLTAKSKSQRNETYGEVRWQVVITNQNNETCATYELLDDERRLMLPAFTSRAELEAEQLRRLKWSVAHTYQNAPYYRAKCDAAGIAPDDTKSLSDLAHLPFTLKSDFRENYPFGMLAVPREQCVRIHASSGTSGKPTIVAYTQGDLDLWNTLIARCILVAGGRPGDVLHNAFGYGLFTGGLGLHGGAEKLGCAVVPASGGQTERQVQLICDLKPRIICATPSYMLALAEELERAGVDPRETSLEIGLHGAEPWSEEMRGEIERLFGTLALDLYGLSEVLGPGVAQERADARGALTVWEDAFYPEIVDPETGTPLPDGEEGELVFTSLSKEAVPIIRYRTGDLSRLSAPVGGIPMRRMDRIMGRSDDMLIIRGVNIFPRQIEELIVSEPGLTAHYRIDVRRDGAMDMLLVTCEAVTNDAALHGQARAQLSTRTKSKYGLTADITIVAPGSLPRSEGKAKRVFDHRKDKP